MALCLAGFATRKDLQGVASIWPALGLAPACYDRLLDFFHSPALDLTKLTHAWCALVFRLHPGILRVNGGSVLPQRSIQVAKAGRKMPAVKKLRQQSESNTKPAYIFGHSCQAVAVLTQASSSVFALPLACRIHEGLVFSNRDHRTLLDKMILLIDSLELEEPFYFVADAYYAADLLWRPVGILVRFVVVYHPRRGAILLMCTDLTLAPLDIIRIYGLRFKIEVSFKQTLRVIGA